MKRLPFFLALALSCCALLMGIERSAHAATYSGSATGRLLFFNALGGFCPVSGSRDCLGAKYNQSAFSTLQPVRETKVYVRDQNNTYIGQGSSGLNGSYTVAWQSNTLPTKLSIAWHLEHKDGRFTLLLADGSTSVMSTPQRNAVLNGVTNFSDQTWGTDFASKNGRVHLYDGAFRAWHDAAYWSLHLKQVFTGIRAYLATTGCGGSSCAGGKEVWMDTNPATPYIPQERIMHEFGHVASALSHENGNYWAMGDYCYPATGTCNSWDDTTQEWKQVSAEEGFANFFSTVGLYSDQAPSPHVCRVVSGPCANNTFNVENESTSCVAGQDRWPLTAMRYFWDVFDARAEGGLAGTDTLRVDFSYIIDVFARYPNGRSNHQKNEGWSCPGVEVIELCWPGDRDARNLWDYQYQASTMGIQTNTIALNNCQ
jgi:hypothetical protein